MHSNPWGPALHVIALVVLLVFLLVALGLAVVVAGLPVRIAAKRGHPQVGRLVDGLEDMGLRENTLIFYIWGDNGSSAEGRVEHDETVRVALLWSLESDCQDTRHPEHDLPG